VDSKRLGAPVGAALRLFCASFLSIHRLPPMHADKTFLSVSTLTGWSAVLFQKFRLRRLGRVKTLEKQTLVQIILFPRLYRSQHQLIEVLGRSAGCVRLTPIAEVVH
jgi:hypothetical protein